MGGRAQGRGSCGTARFFRVPAAQGHAHSPGGTMKSLKKESRLRIPTNRFLEAPESVKGWRWLPWELRKTRQGQGFLGFTTRGLEDGGDTRMEVKITREWGTGQGVPYTCVWALCWATTLSVVTVGPQTSGNGGGETDQV